MHQDNLEKSAVSQFPGQRGRNRREKKASLLLCGRPLFPQLLCTVGGSASPSGVLCCSAGGGKPEPKPRGHHTEQVPNRGTRKPHLVTSPRLPGSRVRSASPGADRSAFPRESDWAWLLLPSHTHLFIEINRQC